MGNININKSPLWTIVVRISRPIKLSLRLIDELQQLHTFGIALKNLSENLHLFPPRKFI